MRKKSRSITINMMADEFDAGISIERMSLSAADEAMLNFSEEAKSAHRHDSHSFFLLEKGTVHIEIDFQQYIITAPSVIYIHPDQVHRTTAFDNMTVCSWAITNENLHPEYLKLLENITPAKPLLLNEEIFSIFSEAISLFMKLTERKSDKLHHSILKDSCNGLVALVASQYLELTKPADKLSRFEVITKSFRELLERNYIAYKRPSDYAEKLNITTAYLNECVKNITGHPVSYHIQQRVVLEAKRLLFYSDKSVKEISIDLGFDDYPYFSRLFSKVTGVTALAFRSKNHG